MSYSYYIKGTTPTFIFTFPNTFDCTAPSKVLLTIKSFGRIVVKKTAEDLDIEQHQISVYLTQAETLSFDAKIKVMINMLYADNSRVATDEIEIDWKGNHVNEVMT